MPRLIYPALQKPVLTQAMAAESVTEDRWHQPWSDPPGRIGAYRSAGMAIALMASGLVLTITPRRYAQCFVVS